MKIKIEDLPQDAKISKEEAKAIIGGSLLSWLLGDAEGTAGTEDVVNTIMKPTSNDWPTFK